MNECNDNDHDDDDDDDDRKMHAGIIIYNLCISYIRLNIIMNGYKY